MKPYQSLFVVGISVLAINSKAAAQGVVIKSLQTLQESKTLAPKLGQGYFSMGVLADAADLSDCVAHSDTRVFGDAQSSELEIYVDNLSTRSDYVKNVTKNLSGEVSYSPLGQGAEKVNAFTASIEGKRTATSSFEYNEKYNYVYLQLRRRFATEIMSDFQPESKALSYFATRPDEFYAKCGDKFISGYSRGAEIIGVLGCESNSTEDKRAIDERIKAKAGYAGVSASGEISSMIEEIKRSSNNRCKLQIVAQGGVADFVLTDSENLLGKSFEYLKSATPATARPMEIQVKAYSAILNEDFSRDILDKVDLKLEAAHAFVANKNSEIAVYQKLSDLAIEQGDAGLPRLNMLFDTISGLEAEKKTCIANASNPNACKAKPTLRLPAGFVIKPSGVHP